MNKFFIPYEKALKLKELGFDESCFASWDETSMKDMKTGIETPIIELNNSNGFRKYNQEHDYNKSLGFKSGIAAPMYQQAFSWFSDKYNIFSNNSYDRGLNAGKIPVIHGYSYRIYNLNTCVDHYGTTYNTPGKSRTNSFK